MIWVIAILVIVVLGIVGALAAGRGDPMQPVYDDRPDVTVPAAGPLRAEDLRRVRFTTAARGYRADEVDALLERLITQLEQAERAPGSQDSTGGPTTDEGHS